MNDQNKCDWDPDILAEVYILTTNEGGRSTPALNGYHPNHKVKDNYLTSGIHYYLDGNKIELGEKGRAFIKFLAPKEYPKCLWINKTIDVTEGEHLIGKATVLEIYNDILNRDK